VLGPIKESADRWSKQFEKSLAWTPPVLKVPSAPQADAQADVAVLGQGFDAQVAPLLGPVLEQGIQEAALELARLLMGEPEVRDFFKKSAQTASDNLLSFSAYFLLGFFKGLARDVVSAFVFVLDLAIWVTLFDNCVSRVGLPNQLTLDQLESRFTRSPSCVPMEDILKDLRAMDALIDSLTGLWEEYSRDPAMVWNEGAAAVLMALTVMSESVPAALGKEADKLSSSPKMLGMAGGGTMWVAASMVGPETAELAFMSAGSVLVKVASRAMPTVKEMEEMELVNRLLVAFRTALAGKSKKILAKISPERFKLWKKISPELRLLGGKILPKLEAQLRGIFQRLALEVGAVRNLRAKNEILNARATMMMYLFVEERSADQAVTAKYLARTTRLIQEKVLEAAHIVDERFFERFKDAFALLNWTEKDLMPGISVSALEHRQSAVTFFKSVYGIGVDAVELPPSMASVTTVFNSKLKFFEKLSSADQAAFKAGKLTDVFVVTDKTLASDLIKAHLDLWKRHHPAAHAKLGSTLEAAIATLKAAGK
jgi:hypothetical protein